MSYEGQKEEVLVDFLPMWAVDPEVKVFLRSEGIDLIIFEDEKFRRGTCGMPLIILRRINSPNQYYLNLDRSDDRSDSTSAV